MKAEKKSCCGKIIKPKPKQSNKIKKVVKKKFK